MEDSCCISELLKGQPIEKHRSSFLAPEILVVGAVDHVLKIARVQLFKMENEKSWWSPGGYTVGSYLSMPKQLN